MSWFWGGEAAPKIHLYVRPYTKVGVPCVSFLIAKAKFCCPDVDPVSFGLNRTICMSMDALDARSRRRHREVFFIGIHRVVFAGDEIF